jgi:hypothetical protein
MERADSQPSGAGRTRPPWSPTGIAVLTLLFSPIPAGVLHALNYRRLGRAGRARLAFATNLISGLLLMLLSLQITFWGWASSALLALYFYKTQEPLFQKHRAAGGKKASILPPTLISLGILAVLTAGFLYIAVDRW